MSSTSQSKTAAPPVSKARLSGHIFAIPGALLVIASFFLPWIRFADGVQTLASLNGLQIASGTVLRSSEGAVLFRGSPINFVVPVAGILVLVLVFFAYRRGYVTELDAFGTVGLGLFALLILWGRLGEAGRAAEQEGVCLHLQFGMLAIYLALAALIAAGALHLRAVGDRKPSFRGTMGAWGFMSPASFLVLVFFFIPAILLLVLSLTDLASSNFGDPWTFIGLENYRRMFSDKFFPKILGNTFRYVILTLSFFNVGLALALALLTSNINRRAGFFFRVLWLLPRITPSVVYVVMWRRMAQSPPSGIINMFLGLAGVAYQPNWLSEQPWLFVILVNGFVGASFGLIIFSSAIEAIPKDLLTAARVDGASAWQIIRDITLPMLKWPLLFVTTYQTLSLLVSFEYILLLTEGGPGLYTTEVWALTSYKRALFTYFGTNQWGYGAAWGFVLVAIAIAASIIYLRIFRFDELVQEPKIDIL
jgi:inositol-phosphate transport system permease protein